MAFSTLPAFSPPARNHSSGCCPSKPQSKDAQNLADRGPEGSAGKEINIIEQTLGSRDCSNRGRESTNDQLSSSCPCHCTMSRDTNSRLQIGPLAWGCLSRHTPSGSQNHVRPRAETSGLQWGHIAWCFLPQHAHEICTCFGGVLNVCWSSASANLDLGHEILFRKAS